MTDRATLKDKKKIVIKVGTSSLTYPNGKINLQAFERLAMVISNLQNSGKKIILVSSGAIAVGCGKLNRDERPTTLAGKQAVAAIGQAELIRIYQLFFSEFNQVVAQVLLTRDVVMEPKKNTNAHNTLDTLIKMNIIPIINENDTVSTDEIEYGDNDRLSADVAVLTQSDLLIMLSDIDGLFSADPNKNPEATIINKVTHITPEIEHMACGSNSAFAKGGMATKIAAVKICYEGLVDAVIMNSKEPTLIYDLLDGKNIGTLFVSPDKSKA
jgi:glutamate 5-kinase